jgi:hypothetical protein
LNEDVFRIIEDAIEEGLLGWKGWRKGKYWRRELKKLRKMCERPLFLAKTRSQILKLSISKWKIVLAISTYTLFHTKELQTHTWLCRN